MQTNQSGPEVQTATPSNADRWLTTEEAEAYSKLSRTTLWRLRKAGHIQAAKSGGSVLYDRLALDAYLVSCFELI